MTKETAFVCHSDNHWFALRKVNEIWFNLNSTNINGPQIISSFYLSVLFETLLTDKFLIFVIKGQFEEYDPSLFKGHLSDDCKYYDIDILIK